MGVKIDIYDSEPWTEMDIEYLTAALKHGSTIEDAAQHLCRSGTVEDVRRKAEELGLKYRGYSSVAFGRGRQLLLVWFRSACMSWKGLLTKSERNRAALLDDVRRPFERAIHGLIGLSGRSPLRASPLARLSMGPS